MNHVPSLTMKQVHADILDFIQILWQKINCKVDSKTICRRNGYHDSSVS